MTVGDNVGLRPDRPQGRRRPSAIARVTDACGWSASRATRDASRASCRAASASASRSPARSSTDRGSCSSTSRSARSTSSSARRCRSSSRPSSSEVGITFIYVTHDQEEALTMSDRLAVFNKGRIEQVGAPAEVYERPATRFVAGLRRHVQPARAARSPRRSSARRARSRSGPRRSTSRALGCAASAPDESSATGHDPGRRLPRARHPLRRGARRRAPSSS